MEKVSSMTNKDIDLCIKNIACNDMIALKRLYNEFRIPIYKFALSIVKNKEIAEDIAQEAFLRIRVNAAEYKAKGKARSWIFTIVRNLAISEVRINSKTQGLEEHITDLTDGTDISSMVIENDVSEMLDCLNADEREIVTLHVLADLKHLDIARIINMPYERVRWKYAYAIKKLKKSYVNKTEEGVLYEI